MKSITDEYTHQWVTTIYGEMKNYEHSKQAITNCYGAHKSNHRCVARYTKTDSVRAGASTCLCIFYDTQ